MRVNYVASLLRLGVDDELIDSENEEDEQHIDPSNQVLNEGTHPPATSSSTADIEPCCSSSVVDNNSSSAEAEHGSSTCNSGSKTETVISTDDKELPPRDLEDQPNQEYEVNCSVIIIIVLSHSTLAGHITSYL